MIVRTRSRDAAIGRPSTSTFTVAGSNRRYGSVTTRPSTATRPASIIAAACRRLATPAWLRMF